MAKAAKKAAKKTVKKVAKKGEEEAERRVHEAGDAQRRAGRGRRQQAHSPHGGDEADLGLHQKNKLQDPKNKRTIKADAALKVVFGGKAAVNMFEMTKLVSKHLK